MPYSLTEAAQENLIAIYDYGADTWGDKQAESYFDQLHAHFSRIADNPMRYPQVSHIKPGYRRSVFGSHSIYFKVDADTVVIVAIIGAQDVSRLK